MNNIKNPKYINNNFTTIIYILLLAIQINGCATTTTEIAEINTRQIDSTTEDYYLRTNDNLQIKFFTTPELDEILTIRPDGKISLQLIGDVRAEGLTCQELNETLTKKYETQLNRPIISVIVRELEGQKIYVGGEVTRPREIKITGKLNALQAIFDSGGFNQDANKRKVVIISRGPDYKPVARTVNLKKALKGELPENEYLLKPFDIVFVPETALATMSEFSQRIMRIIPARIWRGFVYEQGSSFNVSDFNFDLPETP